MAGLLGCEGTLPGPVALFINQHPQVILGRALQPVLCPCPWDFSSPGAGPCTWSCWTSWGLHMPTSQTCQSPSGWHPFPPACQPHDTTVCHQQTRWGCAWYHCLLSLTKMLSSTCPNTNPSGTPLITGVHLDIEQLTASLWAWPFNQFLVHQVVHASNPHLSNLETRLLCGTSWAILFLQPK